MKGNYPNCDGYFAMHKFRSEKVTQKSWKTRIIFENFLLKFDRQMHLEKRKIFLFVGQFKVTKCANGIFSCQSAKKSSALWFGDHMVVQSKP